jgi:cardiolipin synthase
MIVRSPIDPDLTLRRRAVRLWAGFVLIQAIFAMVISIRAKHAERRREARRPATYPSEELPKMPLDHAESDMRLYMLGEQFLAELIGAIDRAHEQVLVETFIWRDDETGRSVRDALERAAERGVQVKVMWDWFMSDRGLENGFFPPSIEAYPFKQVKPGLGALRPGNFMRDHRKMVIVDTEIAFVGGYNFGDEYILWRDTHLRVEGLVAREVANAFVDFWNHHTPATATRLDDVTDRPWDPHVLVHRNDPTMATFPIRGMYLDAIDRAEERVWITTAYFVPDRAFRRALTDASRRGVDVRVLLPQRSNHPLTDVLAHGMFEDLLSAGARVFLYRDFMVHAKTAVVDHAWITVGTANLDRWSMLGNYEVNLEVRSSRLADQLAGIFQIDLANCDEVHLDGWRRRPVSWRVSERVLRSLAPLM